MYNTHGSVKKTNEQTKQTPKLIALCFPFDKLSHTEAKYYSVVIVGAAGVDAVWSPVKTFFPPVI